MRALDAEALAALRAEPLVAVIGAADASADAPFVSSTNTSICGATTSHEQAAARHISARRAASGAGRSVPGCRSRPAVCRRRRRQLQAQRAAVAGVPGRRLFVLTGGPGTGKTTTVLRMLLVLIRQRADAARRRR